MAVFLFELGGGLESDDVPLEDVDGLGGSFVGWDVFFGREPSGDIFSFVAELSLVVPGAGLSSLDCSASFGFDCAGISVAVGFDSSSSVAANIWAKDSRSLRLRE